MLDKTRSVSIANVFDRARPKQFIFRPWSRHVLTMLDCFSIFRPCSTKLGLFRLQMCSTVLDPSKIYFDHDRGMFWPCSIVLVSFDHLDKTRSVSIANVFDRAPPKQDIFRPWSRHVLTMLDSFSIFRHARQNSVCFDCKCVRPCSTQARYISTMIAACFDHARLF